MSVAEHHARRRASASKQRLRLWLRILKLQRHLETILRDRLRVEFDTTLPRFDVMAALDYRSDGLRMSELSSFLKVSNGNVTGIVDRLVADGLIMRVPVEGDRRAMLVRLTKKGKEQFAAMAEAHEGWIADLLGDVSAGDADQMIAGLETIDRSLGDRP